MYAVVVFFFFLFQAWASPNSNRILWGVGGVRNQSVRFVDKVQCHDRNQLSNDQYNWCGWFFFIAVIKKIASREWWWCYRSQAQMVLLIFMLVFMVNLILCKPTNFYALTASIHRPICSTSLKPARFFFWLSRTKKPKTQILFAPQCNSGV